MTDRVVECPLCGTFLVPHSRDGLIPKHDAHDPGWGKRVCLGTLMTLDEAKKAKQVRDDKKSSDKGLWL